MSGSLRTRSNAPFSLCAARSAFSAAAVVTATLGVTLIGRLACVSFRSKGRRLVEGVAVWDGPSFRLDTRVVRRPTSSSCCEIAMSMLRYVLFNVSSDGGLHAGC